MTQQTKYVALEGGLDQTAQAIVVATTGRPIGSLNHEARDTGYARIGGYERFDGRPSPTAAGLADPVNSRATRDAARALIQAVPGSGPIRGVWRFNGFTYAWRDNAAGTAGVMFKSSGAGWAAIAGMFPPGGRYRFVTHNFYGASGQRAVYGVNGVGKGFSFNAADAVTFITTGMPVDKPTRVAAYKQHLFYAFPGGSVQNSSTGDPTTWSPTTGAAEIGMGDEITDFISNNADALTILCRTSVASLLGNDATDFQLQPMTDEAGALAFTAQRVGVAIYMDNRGLRSISTTQAYGDFKIGSLTAQIQPTVDAKRAGGIQPTDSMIVRGKDNYRVFFSDGSGISLFMGSKRPSPMTFNLGRQVTCCCSSNDEPDGRERLFFGSDNGTVYELDVGSSFDGDVISAYLRMPYNHLGDPNLLKRWHGIEVEMIASPVTQIGISAEFDYSGGEQPSTDLQMFNVSGGGGFWDVMTWDAFYWSAPVEGMAEAHIDGQGKNMSILIVSTNDDDPGYVLQSIKHRFSVRGKTR